MSYLYTISELKASLKPILLKNGVASAYLFGSYARGEAKKTSDVDIAISFGSKEQKSLLDLVSLKNELQKKLKKKVDVGTVKSLHPLIKKQVKIDFIKIV